MKKSLKNSFHEDEKKHLNDFFNDNLRKNIDPFNRKTSKQIQHENEQHKRHKQFENIVQLEQMKQLEEWNDLQLESILYDSNNERIEKTGTEESKFHENIIRKENLLFLIESEEGDHFGCFI